MIAYLAKFFTPSYFTVLYAFFGGIAYGVTGHKYGFFKVTVTCLICSVVYGAFK